MDTPASAPLRLNLKSASVLIAAGNAAELNILARICKGLGAQRLRSTETAAAAIEVLETADVDLVIVDCLLPDGDGFEVVRALRRAARTGNRTAPAVVVSGRTSPDRVMAARDCGANFVVAKPVSADILFERIAWVTRGGRRFVESGGYVGPDRRFSVLGPPTATEGRREGDGEARPARMPGAELDQTEIDAVFELQAAG